MCFSNFEIDYRSLYFYEIIVLDVLTFYQRKNIGVISCRISPLFWKISLIFSHLNLALLNVGNIHDPFKKPFEFTLKAIYLNWSIFIQLFPSRTGLFLFLEQLSDLIWLKLDRDCLMFQCCQCRDNLCLLIIEEYSIFPWGVLQQYSVFTSESERVLLPSSSGCHQLTVIFSVLRGCGCSHPRRFPGSTQPEGGSEGEAWGRPSQPAGRGSHHPHHEAHLGAPHQVGQLHHKAEAEAVDDKIKSPNWPRL